MRALTEEILEKIRELIQAEVDVGIAGNEEDSSGYRGCNYVEKKNADRVFAELLTLIKYG